MKLSFLERKFTKMEELELKIKNMEKKKFLNNRTNSKRVGLYHYYHTDLYYSMPEINSKYI